MLALVLPLFLQLAAAPQAQGPSAPPAIESQQAKPAEPEMVCTMEPITGTRAKKMRVCKSKSYDKNGERARDAFDSTQRRGDGQAAPGAPG